MQEVERRGLRHPRPATADAATQEVDAIYRADMTSVGVRLLWTELVEDLYELHSEIARCPDPVLQTDLYTVKEAVLRLRLGHMQRYMNRHGVTEEETFYGQRRRRRY